MYTVCIPIPNKKAETVLKAYMDHVYCKYGGSFKILSDNGTEFKNKLMEEISKELGVEYKVYSPPYRPQSNGRIESFHYFLKACIAKHVTPELEWNDVVPFARSLFLLLLWCMWLRSSYVVALNHIGECYENIPWNYTGSYVLSL